MIQRYTRPKMGQIWSQENRFQKMLIVEQAVAEAQGELGIIPTAAANAICRKGKFNVKRILEIEKTTRHDVIAFVSTVAEAVGSHGRFVHFGMTSSDILDTALSLQVRDAHEELKGAARKLEKTLLKQIRKHVETLCAGRTHGMHAEPVSFGLKLSGFLMELRRNIERMDRAAKQLVIGKLSGAVGTYSANFQDTGDQVEKKVCQKLKLTPEQVATQVIPRDRHAEMIQSLAFLGAGLERLAVEFRHLQRTEVSEVFEGFSKGQKGSSAMPHKKNPISSENITGAARMLRSYGQATMENIALWHERDISHSSVERVVFPDAFILADYVTDRMNGVVANLQVDKKQMLKNMELSHGQLFSSHVLISLVEKGLSREKAYEMVQSVSHGLNGSESLEEALVGDAEVQKWLTKEEITTVFSGERHKKSIRKVVDRVLKTR